MEINSKLLKEQVTLPALAASGAIGTAAATVDIVSHVGVVAGAVSLSFTIPAPTDIRDGLEFVVTNKGVNSFSVEGLNLAPSNFGLFIFDAGIWHTPASGSTAADFWRSAPGATTLPDGTTDVTEAIRRNGLTGLNIDPHSTHHVNGSVATNVLFYNSAATLALDVTHNFVEVGAVSPTITLPAAASCPGREYTVTFVGNLFSDTPGNVITLSSLGGNIVGFGSNTAQTSVLIKEGDVRGMTVKSDGTNWQIIQTIDQRFTTTDLYSANAALGPIHSAVAGGSLGNGIFTSLGGFNAGADFQITGDVAQFILADGNFASNLILPPSPVGGNRTVSVFNSAAFTTVVRNANSDMPWDVLVPQGRSIHFEWADGRWNWVETPRLKSPSASLKSLQDTLEWNGTGKISLAGEVNINGRLIVMTAGISPQSPAGYHDIIMPAAGTLVATSSGGTRAVVAQTPDNVLASGGIPLNQWETLWYKIPYGSGAGSVNANFMIQAFTIGSRVFAPPNGDEWIMICSRDDSNKFRWGTGDVGSFGSHVAGSDGFTAAIWGAMKGRAHGNGYFYSPVSPSGAPEAFGFTGVVRWISGGVSAQVNGAGFADADVASRAVGRPVYRIGGATTSWRLMTAAEKPIWFGGALRGNDAIDPASSTVVDMSSNDCLYWVPSMESGATNGNYYIAPYPSTAPVPAHWLPISSRQNAGGNTTIQTLVGGNQLSLRAGDAYYHGGTAEAVLDRLHRKVTHKGIRHCRLTNANFFVGTTTNGVLGSPEGVLVHWADNQMIYGISDGYASWGVQFLYINVPTAGYGIPVANLGSNATRAVQVIGGRRYVPLASWESLWFIPPGYFGAGGSANGDFIVTYYGSNHFVPMGAVLVAHAEGAGSNVQGTGTNKTRIRFADGTYVQAGNSFAVGVPTEYDHAHWSAEWRNVTVAGGTPPAATVPLPAVAGVQGNFPAPFSMQYRQLSLDDDPRGVVELKGLIQLNGDVLANPNIAFIPGVTVQGQPIITATITASVLGDSKAIPALVRLVNGGVGGQNGTFIQVTGSSMQTAVNPYYTLGTGGGTSLAGTPAWITLGHISIPLA